MSIQKLHYENISGTLVRREGLLSWRCPLCKAEGQSLEVMRTCPECGSKEATLPGAQPAPSEQDASVRKAWARFSHELHRSPDAPYQGMADAFEQHFSQSFIDREWRAEATTWAAAWKAAKRHGAQLAPSVPEGWLRAIDEALVVANVGVANEIDTYEQAKAKLDSLLGFHVDAATDPAVNGGWKLVPRPPTPTMVKAGLESSHVLNVHRVLACYDAMIDAAPEAKP